MNEHYHTNSVYRPVTALLLAVLLGCATEKLVPPDVTASLTPPVNRPAEIQTAIPLFPEGEPEQAFIAARDAYKAGRDQAALYLVQRIRETYPTTSWYKRALLLDELILIRLDRESEARAAMLRAHKEYPELADYALYLMADYDCSRSRYSQAAALYEQITERHAKSPLAPKAAYRRAQALYGAGAYALSAELFEAFLQGNQRSDLAADAGLGLGRAWTAEAELPKAVRSYQDILIRHPGSQAEPEAERALAELRISGADVPEFGAEDLYERGLGLHRASQHEKAIDAFTKVLEKDRTFSRRTDVLLRLGISQFYIGKRNEAVPVLERLVREYPGDSRIPDALYWTGKSYSKLGEWDRSLKAFQRLLDKYPDSEWCDDALFLIGNIYRETNNIQNALQFYTRLVQEYPDSKFADSAIWWKAWSRYSEGDLKKADKSLQDLVNRYPRSFLVNQALYWQGRIAEAGGDRARAVSFYDRVMKKGPFTYYGYRAAERKERMAGSGPSLNNDDAADIAPACSEMPCDEDPLAGFDVDDGPPVWTEETKQLFAADPHFRRTLELMHLDLKREAAYELAVMQERLPKKRGMLIGLSKAYFELGDYHRSLMLVLRNYDRYLEAPRKGLAEELWMLAYPQGFWDSIVTYSRKYGQDPYFVAAIIREESQFRTEALSPAGARGLMQVMPSTGEWIAQTIKLPGFDREKLFDSDTGINIGTWYIGHLMRRFRNDPLLVAAAYNAGPEPVASWINRNGYRGERDAFVEKIPYTETRGYVKKVMRNYAEYKRLYGRPATAAAPALFPADGAAVPPSGGTLAGR